MKMIGMDYKWNVMDEIYFKDRVNLVFDNVASVISKTLGPYGSQIVLDNYGEPHITKDGWNILKKIRFDVNEPALNSIYKIIQEIAATVVMTVGDGSTSSIVLADALHTRITENPLLVKLRMKEKQRVLNEVVEQVTMKLQSSANIIDREGDMEEIFNIAYIATNGDYELSKMIQEIYLKTKNPTIYIKEADGSETSYDVIEGYRALLSYVDPIYINSDDGNCYVKNPYILLFNHKLSSEGYYDFIMQCYAKAKKEHRRLVLAAPYYDKSFRDSMIYYIKQEQKVQGKSDLILCLISAGNNALEKQYSDFAMLCGATMVTPLEMQKYIDDLYKIKEASIKNEEKPEDLNNIDPESFLGTVSNIVIGNKETTINGLINRNEDEYRIHLNDATAHYNEVRETNKRLGIISVEEYDLKQRLAKLKCSMGSIYVGGSSNTERKSNYDLLEDAVRACESAFNYGYNIGGNLSIYNACNELYNETSEEVMKEAYLSIMQAVKDLYRTLLLNKYKNDDDCDEIINNILNLTFENGCEAVYDLTTDRFNSDIVNSCRTDIEILKASISIILSLFTSSVFVSIDTIQN